MKSRYLIGDFSDSALVRKARDLVPTLRKRADKQWSQSRLLDETVEDLYNVGIFRAFQPARWGGGEHHPSEIFEAVMTLAEGDASVGWVAGVVGVHSFHLALFDERAQTEVWGNTPKALIGSPYAPMGVTKRVDDGYLLSGTWRFSSGCHQCDWTFLGANLPDEQGVVAPFIGERWAALLLPKGDYEIVENWNVHGLRATGSHDIVVKDAFVPDHRVMRFSQLQDGTAPGLKTNTGALYKYPYWQMFGRATSSVVPVGALKGMIDHFIEASRERTSGIGAKVGEDPGVTLAIAQGLLTVDDIKSALHRSFAKLDDWIVDGNVERWDERRMFRFQGSFGPKRCADAASELYRVFGGSAIFQDFPFGRQLNDILAIRSHFTNHFQLHANNLVAGMMGLPVTGLPA